MLLSDLLPLFAPEGDGTPPGGSGTNPPAGDPELDDDPEDDPEDDKATVSRAKYLKERKANAKYREKLREYEATKAKEREDALKEQGKFKELLEATKADLEKERAERQAEREKLFSDVITFRKEKAITNALGQTVDPKFAPILKGFSDKIKIDDDGKVDEVSAKKVADEFKATYPELLQGRRSPGTPNPGSGGATAMTKDEWAKMPTGTAEERAKKWAAAQLVAD